MANVLDQSFTTTGDNYGTIKYGEDGKWAQQFTPSFNGKIDEVHLYLSKSGSPTGNCWAEIWSDTGANLPSVKLESNSSNVDVSTLTGSPTEKTFTFTTPITTDKNTKYWLVINGSLAQSTSNCINWSSLDAGGYAGGIRAYFNGASWTAYAAGDFLFKEYAIEILAASSGFFALLGGL